jgi:hypothetical protein
MGHLCFGTRSGFDPDSMGRMDPDPGEAKLSPPPKKKITGKKKMFFMEVQKQLFSFW